MNNIFIETNLATKRFHWLWIHIICYKNEWFRLKKFQFNYFAIRSKVSCSKYHSFHSHHNLFWPYKVTIRFKINSSRRFYYLWFITMYLAWILDTECLPLTFEHLTSDWTKEMLTRFRDINIVLRKIYCSF